MSQPDLVALSVLPHCAPIPKDRSASAAAQWAKETYDIIQQHPGVSEMRKLKTTRDIIQMDWDEGLLALGEQFSDQEDLFWNISDPPKNPVVLAVHQNKSQIISALFGQRQILDKISTHTIVAATMSVKFQDLDLDNLHTLTAVLKNRRERAEKYDVTTRHTSMFNMVLSKALREHRWDVARDLYDFNSIERLWITEGLEHALRPKQQMLPDRDKVIEDMVAQSKPKQLAMFLAQHPEELLKSPAWVQMGNTVFQLILEEYPNDVKGKLDTYQALLDMPKARQIVPRMKAWESRQRLTAHISSTPKAKRAPGL